MKSQTRIVDHVKSRLKLPINLDSDLIYRGFVQKIEFGVVFMRVHRQFFKIFVQKNSEILSRLVLANLARTVTGFAGGAVWNCLPV